MGARQSAEVGNALKALAKKGADIREVAARFGLALSTLYRAIKRQKKEK
jgi:transposase